MLTIRTAKFALAGALALVVLAAAPRAQDTTTSVEGAPQTQDSDTSFAGPPPAQADVGQTPFGVGFNQQGGELSAQALEQAAMGTPTVNYHYYPSSPSSPPAGFADATYTTPMSNQTRNASWHLYGGRNETPATPGMMNDPGAGYGNSALNYHIQESALTGGGQSVGDWAPMAEGGMGTISGFNWGEPYGFD